MNDKKFYIQSISALLERCNDVALLDLVFRLLCKSISGKEVRT